MLGLVATVVTGALLRRQLCLWNLTDVGDPFDVSAFTASDVPESDNAFTFYRQALRRFEPFEGRVATSEIGKLRRAGWSAPSSGTLAWMQRNREALALWKVGAERPGAIPGPTTPHELQTLNQFTLLALLEAARLRSVGDMDGAWELYQAILRTERHTQKRAPIYVRMRGIGSLAFFRDQVITWAKDPRVSKGSLRRALDEVVSAEALCPANAETLKAEYVILVEHLNDRAYLKRTVLTAEGDRTTHGDVAYEDHWYRYLPWYEELRDFLNHEPERSRRVARLVFTNWIAHADGVRPFRSEFTDRYPDLFVNNPPTPAHARVYPSGLHDWLATSRMWELGQSSSIGTDFRKKERTILAQVIVALSEELYLRDHGHAPSSVDELVGSYLEHLPEELPSTVPAPVLR